MLGALACHVSDDAIVFSGPTFPLRGGLRRLTYNPLPDVSPVWSPDGRVVSYVSQIQTTAAASLWSRVAVPESGGAAREEESAYPVLFGTEPLPVARAPKGTLVAVSFLRVQPVSCPCNQEPWPTVSTLVLVAVDTAAPPQSPSLLPTLTLTLAGVDATDSLGIPSYRVLFTPVFARRRDDRAAAFGPSWAPDGTRLVVSDGDRLWVWNAATGSRAPVPGVGDAGFPHWSPDGARIAFAHYARDSVRANACVLRRGGDVVCYASHTTTATNAPDVWVVARDGTNLTRVGPGEEAAWLPASNALLVRRGTGLVLVNLTTGSEQLITSAEAAGEPAISPDGRRAAFVARATGNLDLWTVALSP